MSVLIRIFVSSDITGIVVCMHNKRFAHSDANPIGVKYKCMHAQIYTMGEEEDTSVRVKAETWKRLDELKDSPGKTFDDVINELLDESESSSGKRSPADPVLAD